MNRIKELYKPPILAAFGNPLLDMCAKVIDLDILNKYGLAPNGEKELTDDELDIFRDVRTRYDVEYHPGGAAQNTLRIFQWLIGSPFYSVFLGGIGKDEEGQMLENLVRNSGVETRYKYHENLPTGRCLALINNENRSLVVHLCAANVYRPEDLDVAENLEILNQVYMVYIESFFISHSFDVSLKLLEVCQGRKIPVVFNIGSVYMCRDHTKEVIHLTHKANIVMGNKGEYLALGKAMGLQDEDVKSIALSMHKMNNGSSQLLDHPFGKYIESLGKIFVVTDGKETVLCVYGKIGHNPSVVEFTVPKVDEASVVDTTGAGDAFIAGFLAGVFSLNNVETCLAWGCWSARQVIQLIGCQVPSYPPDEMYKIKF